MFPLQKPRSKVWLGLTLTTFLVSCFPQNLPHILDESPASNSEEAVASSSKTLSENQANALKAKAEIEVHLGVMLGSKSSTSQAMALVSAIGEVDYRLSGCASGNGSLYTAIGPSIMKLYKFDRNCVIGLERVKIEGVNYTLPVATNFNTQLNARTPLQSSSGKVIYAFVQSQLPALLNAPSYSVGFVLSENELGSDKFIPVYEIGLTVNRSQITETNSQTATFTLRRAVPSIGKLTVSLVYSGTATPGVDTNPLPSTVQFLDGQSQVSFDVTAVDDTIWEPTETITVNLGLGAYLSKAVPLTVEIIDNDVAILNLSSSSLNFGTKALNLPHDYMAITVTNTGNGAATAFQLTSSLAAPFFFPNGYPGEGGTCGATINPQSSCILVLGFNPTALGNYSNAVTFTYFDCVATQNLNLNLSGTGANVGYLKTNLGKRFDFGVVTTGTPAKKHIVLDNIGTGTLSSINLAFGATAFGYAGGSFPGTGGSCSTSLAVNSSCTIVITYTSATSGAVSSSLTFSYNNGAQMLSFAVALEATASSLVSENLVVSTALNTARSLTLAASGGTGTKTYTVDRQPVFGTLTGTAPNLTYTPNTGFSGQDSFTFRANDNLGPSASAEVRILVQPKALFIVANPSSLVTMDQRFKARLEAKGFVVTMIDDGATNTTQALGKDLIAVSASVKPSSVLTKFRDVTLPVIIWERGLYDDMKLISSNSFSGSTGNVDAIRILENNTFMNRGYTVGNLPVLTSTIKLSYVLNNDPNVMKFSSVTTSTSQLLEFGYDGETYLPGGMIAPARRLGTFYPSTNGDFNASGTARVDRNIDWALQNPISLLYDSFQRNASTALNNGWRETETLATAISTDGQQMKFQTFDNVVQARNSFPIQKYGVMTASFFLNLKRTGSLPTDYQLKFQLGRCDLMDNNSSVETGVAVNLLWGGINSGMATENSLGYRQANGTIATLGTLNNGQAFISVEADLDTNTYKITSPLGTTGPIAFQNNVPVDCVKWLAKNINSQEFSAQGVHHLQIFEGS